MAERQKNTILGAVAFGLGFSILQLILSFEYTRAGLMVFLVLMLAFALLLGAFAGLIFGFAKNDQRQYVIAGIKSFGQISVILWPLTVFVTHTLYFTLRYVFEHNDPKQLVWWFRLLLETPLQMFGTLFGILVGIIISIIFRKGSPNRIRIYF